MTQSNNDVHLQATHFAVPVKLFQAVAKVLGTMSYDQVSELMLALNQCRPLAISQDAKPGDNVPGLKSVEGGKE